MHPHTKQWLDKFDELFGEAIDEDTMWHFNKAGIEGVKAFLQQALLSQAQMIRDKMVPRHKPLKAYNDDLRIGYNTALHEAKNNLDKLINSFK